MTSLAKWKRCARRIHGQVGGGRTLRYLWPLRVPIISSALLIGWPWIAFSDAARPYLSGIFDPVDPRAIVLITTLALLNAWAILIIFCLVVTYGEARLGLPAHAPIVPPSRKRWWAVSLFAVPVTYKTVTHVSATQDISTSRAIQFALMGVGVAVVLLAVALGIQWLLRKLTSRRSSRAATAPHEGLFDLLLAVLARYPSLGEGFLVKGDPKRLAVGHGQAFGLASASVLAYVATGYFTSDIHRPVLASTLGYVLLLQLMLTWLAGIAAFLFDRSRAPLFVFIGLLFLAVNYLIHPLWSTDHVYRTDKLATGLVPERVSPAMLMGTAPVSIVVAASGGGIQSAAWTARVLSGLDEVLPQFRSHVRLISAVSGGSVGAMNVLTSWPECGPPLTADEAIRPRFDANAASRESSLHAVGWGLVFKDLPRTVVPFFSSPEVDRGSVLEDAWKRESRLQRPYPTDAARPWIGPPLAWWRLNVGEKACPGVIYNAMVAETGEPLLFSTVGLPRTLAAFDFYARYAGRDVPMTTAARLSAGFPYVSPASRADVDVDVDRYAHVVDGGYFDNYGVVSLAALVHEALEAGKSPPALRRILVIEICDTAQCSGKESNGDLTPGGVSDQSWVYQLTAPLSAVMNMRSSAQRVNNREALRLLKAYWRTRGACIESIEASFDGAGAPMSWHLTAEEKRNVDVAWALGESRTVVQAVIDFLYRRETRVGSAGFTSALCGG